MSAPYLGPDRARCKQHLCARKGSCARYLQWVCDGDRLPAVCPAPPGLGLCGLYESSHKTPWHSHAPQRATASDAANS